jgi:hypothetical protein
MSSSDKTKSQLIDSMRMSKSGVGETTSKETTGKSATVKKKASKAKQAPAKTTAKKPAAKKPAVAATSGRVSIPSDSYESGMRIWPD